MEKLMRHIGYEINLRTEPNLKSEVVGTLKKGELFTYDYQPEQRFHDPESDIVFSKIRVFRPYPGEIIENVWVASKNTSGNMWLYPEEAYIASKRKADSWDPWGENQYPSLRPNGYGFTARLDNPTDVLDKEGNVVLKDGVADSASINISNLNVGEKNKDYVSVNKVHKLGTVLDLPNEPLFVKILSLPLQ